MDYDDSEFGGQNPQLNREEVSKASPVLSEYSPPKYDFDDSLQGVLRFDSLGETETFLGIESQEDTSWIDDFSRGSRMEFSSQDAEPDSISRRNNVWSEATSLESVEMLLKSVGQEDAIHGVAAVQDCGAVHELGSSGVQFRPNEEDTDRLSVEKASLAIGSPVDKVVHKLQDVETVKQYPTEDSSRVFYSGNNGDSLVQEINDETTQCPVTTGTQATSNDDDPSVGTKPELNLTKAASSIESELQEYAQAPMLQSESQGNCLHTAVNVEIAESLSSGLDQGNANSDLLNENLQVTGSQDYTEGPLNVSVEVVDDMVLEKEFKSEGHSAENILENVVSPECLGNVPGSEPGTIGNDNNCTREPYASYTEDLHDFNSAETCPGEIATSSPAEDTICETGKHSDSNVCEGSNVNIDGEITFVANSAEATNPNSDASCEEKLLSDAPLTAGAGVQNNSELFLCTELNENRVESLKKDDDLSAASVEEDKIGGGSEQMVDAVALKKAENDVLGIPSSKMDIELAEESSSPGKVFSSVVLENAAQANEDPIVSITPQVTDECIAKVSDIPDSTIIEEDAMETNASITIFDENDKSLDSLISLQSNSKALSVEENVCSTGGLLINDKRVVSPVESVSHIHNEGTPCDSPSVIPSANGKDNEEPDISHPDVSVGGESKFDPENVKLIQCQSDTIGTSCTNDGSVCRDPKASDAPDSDKTFSFVITSSAEHSEREAVKLWQPFTSQVPVSSQNVNDSPSAPRAEQITLRNQGSKQNTDGQTATGSKSASVLKPRRVSSKSTKESAKRESRQKSTTPSKLKESNIFSNVESGLPDSNIASPRLTGHLQQFTDLQQLQLRAQIFVYGSLIQGTAPDEACMGAAFGGSDGGRSIWESARQRCLERIQSQKPQDGNPGTPMQQHSSAKIATQKVKSSKSQTKGNVLSRGKASKSTPVHTTISHLTPAASPLWTLHTPDRMHFGGTPSKTFLEHNVHPQCYPQSSSPMTSTDIHMPSWPPHPDPWVASPSPQAATSKASPSIGMRSKMEPVILTPVGKSSMSEISVRHSNPGPIAHSIGLNNAITGAPPLQIDDRTFILNSGQTFFNSKPSKRKQVELNEASMVTEPHLKFETASAACASSILPSTIPTPISESKIKTSESALANVVASPGEHTTNRKINVDDRIVISDDIFHKVDDARLHAEDAAAYSAAAVDLSQKMWSQLARQKDSGGAPDVEAKLASAALAISAAVAVAKAAAAAAKVASDAAVQVKIMAEEAMDSSRISLVGSSTEISLDRSISSSGNAMLGENAKNSVLLAVHEAESASAALKRAENLNAIMKAAELAAEAVTQAGKVAVMSIPLPLSELANAGPEGCWKLNFGKQPQSATVSDCHEVNAIEGAANAFSGVKETVEVLKKTSDDCSQDNIPGDGCQVTSMNIGNNDGKPLGTPVNPIKEGSSVEIYKESDGIKAAWYSATVLELKNGEAYVCYTEKSPTESSGELKEWIQLDIHGNEAPKIRTAHPMTAMPTEGTRKRRREAMGKSFWSVGDRVDAWKQNCWWEGVITDKSSKDDTAFTVHFPAQVETCIVKGFYLRPSLIWHDGKWVEWSSSMSSDEDTRKEKRMKLHDPKHEVGLNEKASENVDPIVAKIQEDSQLLGLSDNENKFNVGKSNKDVKKPVTRRTARAGLQSEGKTVSFGVPKPGKKRKFMDVSQHLVARDSKTTDSNDSTKRGKVLIPKGSGLPGWKNSTRIDMTEKKGPMLPNSRKPAAIHDRALDKKNVPGSVSHNNNALRSQGTSGFAAFSTIGRSRNSPFEFSSTSNDKSSKKLLTSTSSKSEIPSKTKFEPPSQKLGKIEENKVYNSTAGNSDSEGLEPRRSNRRIQPTSRLLEGLQTSLSITKQPSVSHDKGSKGHNRSNQ